MANNETLFNFRHFPKSYLYQFLSSSKFNILNLLLSCVCMRLIFTNFTFCVQVLLCVPIILDLNDGWFLWSISLNIPFFAEDSTHYMSFVIMNETIHRVLIARRREICGTDTHTRMTLYAKNSPFVEFSCCWPIQRTHTISTVLISVVTFSA